MILRPVLFRMKDRARGDIKLVMGRWLHDRMDVMRRFIGGVALALSLAGCADASPTRVATSTVEIMATESASATVAATAGEAVTETALPTLTALPVLERYEAITPPPINAAAFSPDGARLAYVTTVGITMLDAANEFAVLWEAPLIGVESFGLAWSADGTRLITIRAMERNNSQTDFISVIKASVLTVDASNGAVISEIGSDALRVPFDVSGQLLNGGGSVFWTTPGALSRDGARYLVARPSELILGESETGAEQSLSFAPPYDTGFTISGMAFSEDGARFAAAGEGHTYQSRIGGTVQVWRLDGLEVEATFEVNQPGSLAFSPDGSQIAVLSGHVWGGSATGLHVFDLTTGEELWSQYGEYHTLAWSEFGIYTELDGRLVRYHPETGNRYKREVVAFPAYLSTTWLEASAYGVIRVTPEILHLVGPEEMESRVLASGFLPAGEAGMGLTPYHEVATYSPDGSAVALRSHSYVWVRSAESTYWKGIEGTGALAWSPDSERIAIGRGQEIAVWDVWGALVGQTDAPIPVNQVMWLTDEVIVVAGVIGEFGESVGGWDVSETGFAAIDLATGETIWRREGFSAVRHITAAGGRIVIEEQRGEQGLWYLVMLDAATGETVAEIRIENAVNFPAIPSPDGTRVILKEHAQYSLFDGELALIDQSGGAGPGAIQWAADSGSVMAMGGSGHYSVWDRELGVICQEGAGRGLDGLARAIHPAWREVIFETQQRVLEVWRINEVCG